MIATNIRDSRKNIALNDFAFGLLFFSGRRSDPEGEWLPGGGRRPPGGRASGEESASPGSQNSK